MYTVQQGNRFEAREGRIVAVRDETLTVEDAAGVRAEVPVSSLQGWVYDPTPVAVPNPEPVEQSLSEGVRASDPA